MSDIGSDSPAALEREGRETREERYEGIREERQGKRGTKGRLLTIPYTLYPIPYTLYPIPYTLYPIPYTLVPDRQKGRYNVRTVYKYGRPTYVKAGFGFKKPSRAVHYEWTLPICLAVGFAALALILWMGYSDAGRDFALCIAESILGPVK